MKRYITKNTSVKTSRIVDPRHFYAADVPGKGLGLFCEVALEVGDCWWVYNDPYYVARAISFSECLALPSTEREEIERLCFVELGADEPRIVMCAEPFCRVNHSMFQANSFSDPEGNSVVSQPITAHHEITIPYTYEVVCSLLWKFPSFRERVTPAQREDPLFTLQPVTECELAMQFLRDLG